MVQTQCASYHSCPSAHNGLIVPACFASAVVQWNAPRNRSTGSWCSNHAMLTSSYSSEVIYSGLICASQKFSQWYATSSGSETKGQIFWAEAFPSHSHQTAKILQQGMYFFVVYFCSVWRAQHNNSDSCHSALHLCAHLSYWPVFKHCFPCRHEPTRLSGNSCRKTITARKICNYSSSKRQHGSTWMHHVQ